LSRYGGWWKIKNPNAEQQSSNEKEKEISRDESRNWSRPDKASPNVQKSFGGPTETSPEVEGTCKTETPLGARRNR